MFVSDFKEEQIFANEMFVRNARQVEVTVSDCACKEGLALDMTHYREYYYATIDVPECEPLPVPTEEFIKTLRALPWPTRDSHERRNMIIGTFLENVFSPDFDIKRDLAIEWKGASKIYYGVIDFMVTNESSCLIVRNGTYQPIAIRDREQTIAMAGCVMRMRLAQGLKSPVYAALFDGSRFWFFVVTIDGVVRTSIYFYFSNREAEDYPPKYDNPMTLRKTLPPVLAWFHKIRYYMETGEDFKPFLKNC